MIRLMLDAIKIKKYLLVGLKILVAVELLGALSDAFGGSWSRLGADLVIAGVLYIMWDRIKTTIRGKKEEYRRKMESPAGEIRLWDAFAFSLLWSDEIYSGIPKDHNRLVVISYTLIAIGIVATFVSIGPGFMSLIVSAALVLAAVNLLAWVVSTERGEKESLQTELKLAHDVQVSLMPDKDPKIEGIDVAGRSMPAKEVGGDHFAYSGVGSADGLFRVSVFDVSGKGMQAAMSAVFTSGAFASEAAQSTSPAAILTRLNKAVYANTKRGHFVAFLLAHIDMKNRTLSFANAGQTKPLRCSNGSVQWLDGEGVKFPLGMVSDSSYQDRTLQLHSGDVLLLMTDGFTEAMNAQQEQFGFERMEQCISTLDVTTSSSTEIIRKITNAVRQHMQFSVQHDDMTMVVVKIL